MVIQILKETLSLAVDFVKVWYRVLCCVVKSCQPPLKFPTTKFKTSIFQMGGGGLGLSKLNWHHHGDIIDVLVRLLFKCIAILACND